MRIGLHGSRPGTHSPVVACILLIWSSMCVAGATPSILETVVGRIADTNGQPVAFANVVVDGTNWGCFSRTNGVFLLTLPPDVAGTLRVAMPGYQDTTFAFRLVPQTDTLRVVLRPPSLRGYPDVAGQIVHDIRASEQVEVFLLDILQTPSTGARFFRHTLISAACPSPDSTALAAICGVLLAASRDSCGPGPMASESLPRYAFRFYDRTDPLELIVTDDCQHLFFSRGVVNVPSGCGGGFRCVAAELCDIMASVFPKGSER